MSGFGGSSPQSFAELNGTLYFLANDGVHGQEVWMTDGTDPGTQLLVDVGPGSNGLRGFFSSALVEAGGSLYFVADDGVNGDELWSSDGTALGTALVADIAPGSDGSFRDFTVLLETVGSSVYFAADDRTSGAEAWTSDGTAMGTVQVADVATGAPDSDPDVNAGFASAGGNVFWVAQDAAHGAELRSAVPEPGLASALSLGGLGLGWLARQPGSRRRLAKD